ncbi:hypothetical protein KCU78_g2300, partial [Aureobasidium melanogenum]
MLAIDFGPDQDVDKYLQEGLLLSLSAQNAESLTKEVEYLGASLLAYPAPHSQIPQPNFTEDSNTNCLQASFSAHQQNSALCGLSGDFDQNQRRFLLHLSSPELAVSEVIGGSTDSCFDHAEYGSTLTLVWNDKAVDMIGNAGPIPDGPVKPEHTWNTALNTCALTTPNFGYLSTQSRHGDTRDLAPSSRTNHLGPLSGLAKRPVERISELDRNARNEYLREARRHGLSYKEIKCRGDFTEAESTLRGRHRNLSKPKEMRVRNPQWNYSDIMLLVKAVGLFSKISRGSGPYMTNSSPRSKVPWKKVAEWMSLHNASYPFASVACAKKWEQI